MDTPLFDNSSLPPELDSRVRAELRDGEQLLWVGQPRPRWFSREAVPLVLFGIPFTAFAVFWTAMALWMGAGVNARNNGPGLLFQVCFPLFGLPFVVAGLGLLTSPYWQRRRALRTCYALTDRRAIVWEAGNFGSVTVRSYEPDALKAMERVEYPDGSGDLVFEEVRRVWTGSQGRRRTSTERRGLLAVDDVRTIETLVRKALLSGEKS
jgi:hypothetical protein